MFIRLADGLLARRQSIVLTLVAILPILWSAVHGIRVGWFPIGDEALTGLSAFDVFNGHPPVMGPRTTTAFETGIETHHPGPVLYYLLAPTSAIADGESWGLIVGSVLISLAIISVGIHTAQRLGGKVAGCAVAAAFLGVQWALGPGAGARPFNPYPPALATLTLLVLTWALIDERLEFVPHYVACASLMVQSHIGYLPFLAGPVVFISLVGIARWGNRRRALWPLQGWRPLDQGRFHKSVKISLVLFFVVWLPPAIELFRFSPNNVERIGSYISADRGSPLPPYEGMRFVVGTLAPSPGGMRAAFDGSGVASAYIARNAATSTSVTIGCVLAFCVLIMAVAGSLQVRSRARVSTARRWAPTRLEGYAAWVVLVGLAALSATVTRLPLSAAQSTWNYLQAWPVTFALWALLVTYLIRRIDRPRIYLTPRNLAMTSVVAALIPAMASPVPSKWHEGQGIEAGLASLDRELSAIDEHQEGGLHVTFDGDTLGAGYFVAPALAFAMKDKYAIHLPAVWTSKEDTDFRKSVTSPEDTAWVSIREGDRSFAAKNVDARARAITTVEEGGIVYTLFVRGPDPS